MKVVIQRVKQAQVAVEDEVIARIDYGLLLLVGIAPDDNEESLQVMAQKIVKLRIFDDENGVMNLSVLQTGADILAVSQFTLMADTRKGNRPSWHLAASPDLARSLFNRFVAILTELVQKTVPTGKFGANMQVSLCNDGPVTILL